jgi:hypothetical protein
MASDLGWGDGMKFWYDEMLGRRFGKLVVLSMAWKNDRGRMQWRCRCDCGEECLAVGAAIVRGRRRSCGCLRRQPRPGRRVNGERKSVPAWVVVDGDQLTVPQAARRAGLCPDVLRNRLCMGWPLEKALTNPVRRKNQTGRGPYQHSAGVPASEA